MWGAHKQTKNKQNKVPEGLSQDKQSPVAMVLVGNRLPTCHVMVCMALTNQRRLRKGCNTPRAQW